MHRRWRGRAVELAGRRLDEATDRLNREIFDVEFRRRICAGRRRTDRRRARLVGVRDAERGSYWFYLTNMAPQDVRAVDLAQRCACRRQVELVFNEVKSHYRFDELPTRNGPVVEVLLLASIITLLTSRRLLDAVRADGSADSHHIPESRTASPFAFAASQVLDLIFFRRAPLERSPAGANACCSVKPWIPKVSGLLLLPRVDRGVAWTP